MFLVVLDFYVQYWVRAGRLHEPGTLGRYNTSILASMDDSKFFEAAQAMAQGLSQWGLLIIGASMIIIVSTGYYRPTSRRMRFIYLWFVPAWILLAASIYRGIQVQGSYVAYLIAARKNNAKLIDTIAINMNQATTSQIWFLEAGLVCLAIWLATYFWLWIWYDKISEPA